MTTDERQGDGRPEHEVETFSTARALGLCHAVVDAVRRALDQTDDWGPAGTRPGQYRSDLAADEAALAVLERAGDRVGVLSEESGVSNVDRPILAVVDPVDGSTNAARRIPWFATSVCLVDAVGPWVAVVANQASGVRYHAVRGGGAFRDGDPIRSGSVTQLDDAIIGLSGWPTQHWGWRQFRALGASALDLCAVADGTLDGFVDCSVDAHGEWDYAGGLLVCREAGASIADAHGRPLIERRHDTRRTPVAASTPELLLSLLAARGQQ